ncbi:muconolactone Delta-isomerase family protein [Streptomyces sp. NPDC004284]|uniref:muconolactone Delta-isomerase family protein n=1 Tax=Streptomyces sp. NPDC004284 TaxID=3364695 RepID=UPI00367AB99B
MREFLVEITTAVPEGTSQEEVDRRRAAEAVRAGELAESGRLARLWRPVGELRGIGVWRAVVGPDRRQVRAHRTTGDPQEYVLGHDPARRPRPTREAPLRRRRPDGRCRPWPRTHGGTRTTSPPSAAWRASPGTVTTWVGSSGSSTHPPGTSPRTRTTAQQRPPTTPTTSRS